MDLEGFTRRRLGRGMDRDEVVGGLADHILRIKGGTPEDARELAAAVVEEVGNTLSAEGDLFEFTPAGVGMGDFGVGSRGKGDFYVHRQIARIIGKTGATVGVDEMDDGGVVPAGRMLVTC
ncbi:MAG: hypothetical protein LUQ60_01910, partial [Methanomicrobiales archaeon]|nr:hypothetical protein [Methanomicrobiales archaeon]